MPKDPSNSKIRNCEKALTPDLRVIAFMRQSLQQINKLYPEKKTGRISVGRSKQANPSRPTSIEFDRAK